MKNRIVRGAMVLLAALLAAPAAQAQFAYTTNNGAITITGYTGAGGAVIIPAEISGLPVTSIGDWAFYSAGVINFTIADTVTNIGDGAFFDCESVTNMAIGAYVASIGDWAFAFCPSLTNVNFRGNPPGLGGTNVFNNDTGSVYYLPGSAGWGPTFGGLGAVLWNPPVPYNYTTNNNTITITGYTGSGGAVVIPNTINFLPVASIGESAFQQRGGLSSVTMPDSVTNIGLSAFLGCPELTSVTIPGSVANIGISAFYNCVSLTNATIANGVSGIGELTFAYCTSLASVTIPGSVDSIGNYAFYNCVRLTNATIASGVSGIGVETFAYCASLGSVTIPGSVTNIGGSAFSRCTSLANVTVGANVASIGDSAFYDCTSLTNITMSASLTSIGDYAFGGCSCLPSITIPAGVSNIGEAAFSAILNVGAFGVLGRCASLTAINVDAQNSFYSSSNGVLFDKSGSTLIQYPGAMGGNYTIPGSVTSIALEAFCATALSGVTIPASVTNFGAYAFAYCTNLTNVTIINGQTGLAALSLAVFEGCSNLTSITIPGSVGSIGGDAFIFCSGLTKAMIGDGVTNIAEYAFAFCTSLTSVYFQGNAPAASSFALIGLGANATAYYLPGTTGWSAFSANTGLPAMLWNPLIQTADGSFGVRANQFGFNITGTTNIPIVVQTCDNLASPVWTPLQSLTLTNGSYYFSEPFQPATPARFYRITSQ